MKKFLFGDLSLVVAMIFLIAIGIKVQFDLIDDSIFIVAVFISLTILGFQAYLIRGNKK